MTEFEVCERARVWLRHEPEGVKVDVRYSGRFHVGRLTGVSPVNAWIKVSGVGKIPAGLVTQLEAHE
jgi:hypothetical protein